MKPSQGILNSIILGLMLWALIIGCAGVSSGIKAGMTALQIVDSFYNHVLEQKLVPNTLQAATIILQQADVIAALAKDGKNTPELIAQAKLLSDQANKL